MSHNIAPEFDIFFNVAKTKFITCQTQFFSVFGSTAEKEAMLTQFQAYLSHTHEMGVDEACQALLGERFSTLVQEYVQSMQTENSNNH